MNSMHSQAFPSDVSENFQRLVANVPELVHSWRFLAGVLYALDQYYQIADRSPRPELTDERYLEETMELLSCIKEGQFPAENWLRAFFYNAAVMRLDAAYERFFRACLSEGSKNMKGPKLYKKIRMKFPSCFPYEEFKDSPFGQIRKEVNSLKHDPGGADASQRELPDVLHSAMKELVAFLGTPGVIIELQKTYSTKGVVVDKNCT